MVVVVIFVVDTVVSMVLLGVIDDECVRSHLEKTITALKYERMMLWQARNQPVVARVTERISQLRNTIKGLRETRQNFVSCDREFLSAGMESRTAI